MVITIDGPSGAGKSTVADMVSVRLGIPHLNTGEIYRAVTVSCIDAAISPDDALAIDAHIKSLDIDVAFIGGVQQVLIDGVDLTRRLRDNEVSRLAPSYSVAHSVRERVSQYTRTLASRMDLVLDGRDSGSYVLPDARHKFYLTASISERARRRHIELAKVNKLVPIERLITEMESRDRYDMSKVVAPLMVPIGAIVIDNTELNLSQTCDKILHHVQNM